jgi:hypothetical protein
MMRKSSFKDSYFTIGTLVLISLYLLWRHFYLFTTYFGFDDMHYADIAHRFAQGDFSTQGDHYVYRWGFLFPVALCYKLFGIHDLSSGLMSMICTLGVTYLLWRSQVPSQRWMAIIGLLFFLTYEWTSFYADKLMPDVPSMAFIFLALWVMIERRMSEPSTRSSLAFILALVMAFLIKESIFLLFPIFGIFLIVDTYQYKRLLPFWRKAIMFSIVSAIAYVGLCALFYGSPWARVEAIVANEYFSQCSYAQLPLSATLSRIFKELPLVFLQTGLLAPLGLLYLSIRSDNTKAKTWAVASIGLILCANFMTTSLTHYSPLCPDIRHFLWIVPSMSMAILNTDLEKMRSQDALVAFIINSLLLALSMHFYSDGWPIYVFWLLAMIFVFIKASSLRVALIIALSSLYAIYLAYAKVVTYNYDSQKVIISKHFGQPMNQSTLVISNSAEINMDRYITQFRDNNIQWIKQQDLRAADLKNVKQAFYIANGMTSYLTGLQWEDNPTWVKQPKDVMIPIDSLEGIIIHQMNIPILISSLE